MAKRIILTLLQFIAFVACFTIGGNWDVINLSLQIRAMQNHTTSFNPIPVIKTSLGANYILIADGLIFAAVLLLLILLFEAARKALKPWVSLTFLAFVLAAAYAFVMKIGLPPSHS